jgi:FkbM family methyltransferase
MHQTHEYGRMRALERNKIDLVIDVGANIGQYAKSLRDAGYGESILSFEPLPDAFLRISKEFAEDKKWIGVNAACGSKNGKATINISADSVCSSLSTATEDFLKSIPSAASNQSLQVEVTTLDLAAKKYITEDSNVFLKIDVQGFESQVLSGAKEVLKKCRVLEIEISIASTYESAMYAKDALAELDAIGFELLSIGRGYADPSTGCLLDADFLFGRKKTDVLGV